MDIYNKRLIFKSKNYFVLLPKIPKRSWWFLFQDPCNGDEQKGDDQHHLWFDPIHTVLITIGVLYWQVWWSR